MVRFVLVMLAALHLSGCADFARWVRQYTYPPEFRYVERAEVRATMRELAAHSHQLTQLLHQDEAPREHRGEIIEHLRAMEQAAEKLDQSGWPTNHPKVDMNLPSFCLLARPLARASIVTAASDPGLLIPRQLAISASRRRVTVNSAAPRASLYSIRDSAKFTAWRRPTHSTTIRRKAT